MITLKQPDITTVQSNGPSGSVTTVTDTLFVSSVRFDMAVGAMYATIERGTTVNGVFTSNFPTLQVTVNPDGSFISSDGSWSGSVGAIAAQLVNTLAAEFDQFIIASGSLSGTIVPEVLPAQTS
jgi:hypothetical protein